MVKIYNDEEKKSNVVKSDVTQKKIMVSDVDQSVEVQRKLFDLGCKWMTGETYPMNTHNRFLYVDGIGKITCSHDNKRFFDKHEYTEMYYEDLIKLKTNDPDYSLKLVYDYGEVDVVIVDNDDGEQVVDGHILSFTEEGKITLHPGVNRTAAEKAGLKLDYYGTIYVEN